MPILTIEDDVQLEYSSSTPLVAAEGSFRYNYQDARPRMTSTTTTPPSEAILHCERVVLEPIVPAHAELLFESLQAPELYTFIPHSPPSSKEVLRTRYVKWAARMSPDGSEAWLNYAIRQIPDGVYVGTVQATVAAPPAETYIAYQVFPEFFRLGFAQEACTRLLVHLFAGWQIGRVRALVDTRNVPSWSLLERLKFKCIETIPDADHFKGTPSSEYVYELNRPTP